MATKYVLLQCLLGALVVLHGHSANPEAFRILNTAFGQKRVEAAFDSAASMDSAFEHEYANMQGVSIAEASLRPRLGCASYKDGQEIGE